MNCPAQYRSRHLLLVHAHVGSMLAGAYLSAYMCRLLAEQPVNMAKYHTQHRKRQVREPDRFRPEGTQYFICLYSCLMTQGGCAHNVTIKAQHLAVY